MNGFDKRMIFGSPNWNTYMVMQGSLYVKGSVSGSDIINRSLESIKKDIKKPTFNAIKEIMDTDIYEYLLKEEKDGKKHLGVIIGDKYKCSDRIINKQKDGISIYSMTSILWKAIQEQQEEIEELKKEIEKLKGGK